MTVIQPLSTGTNWHKSSATTPATQLAKPWLFRRHGRYYLRLRPRNQLLGVYSVALRTSSRSVAIAVTKAITQALDHFHLNNPEATWPELRARLVTIAEEYLEASHSDDGTDWASSESYRGMYLALRQIGKRGDLTTDQFRAVGEGQQIMAAANARAEGDPGALVRLIDRLKNEPTIDSPGHASPPLSVCVPSEPLSWPQLSALYLTEHSVNLKASSRRNTINAHKSIERAFDAIGVTDLRGHTRETLVALRTQLGETRKVSSVNELIGKLSAVLAWAVRTDKLPKNYTEKLKITKGGESERKAFTREQVVTIMAYANALPTASWERWLLSLGVITGARIGELCHLTAKDIRQVEGLWCIDINEDEDGKSIKNKHSKRLVPLVDGAFGFNLATFLEAIKEGHLPSAQGINGDSASRKMGPILKTILKDNHEGSRQTFHSLRRHFGSSMQAAGVEVSASQAAMGHATGTITYDLYGSGVPLQRVHAAMQKAFLEVAA